MHFLAAIALIGLGTLSGLACSGGGRSASAGVSDAIDKTKAAGTARFVLSGERAASGPIQGVVDFGRSRARVQAVGRQWIFDRDVGYQLGGFPRAQGKWVRFQGVEFLVRSLPLNPDRLLEVVRSTSDDVEEVGSATIQGMKTTRYRGVLRAEQLSPSAREGTVEAVPFELWVDEDGLIRRLRLRYDRGSDVAIYHFSQFGRPAEIHIPRRDEFVTLDELERP